MHRGMRVKALRLLNIRHETPAVMRAKLLHVILITAITFRATKHIFLKQAVGRGQGAVRKD